MVTPPGQIRLTAPASSPVLGPAVALPWLPASLWHPHSTCFMLQEQMLRWNLGCKMLIRDHSCGSRGEMQLWTQEVEWRWLRGDFGEALPFRVALCWANMAGPISALLSPWAWAPWEGHDLEGMPSCRLAADHSLSDGQQGLPGRRTCWVVHLTISPTHPMKATSLNGRDFV